MSFKALAWAISKEMDHSPSKFVLVAMANYADEKNICYPSAMRLAKDTCLNIKTIPVAIKRLKLLGLINDTGRRMGRTGKTVVYQLIINEQQDADVNTPENGCVAGEDSSHELSTKTPEYGGIDEGGNTPKYSSNTPEYGGTKYTQIRVSEPINNKPIIKPENYPPGLNTEAWALWIEYREESHFKKYNLSSTRNAMLMMIGFGDIEKQLATVRNAITKQWKHLHPITTGGNNGTGKRSSAQILADNTTGAFESG